MQRLIPLCANSRHENIFIPSLLLWFMLIVVARYRVKQKFQKRFKQESNKYFSAKMRQAQGFVRLLFLRNALDPEFVDVVTEWCGKRAFLDFVRLYPNSPPLAVPHEILERYLFEPI